MKYILLLDDDPDEYELLEAVMKEINLPVELKWFRESDELCSYLETATLMADILLLDINLPKVTGLECLKELKTRGFLEHLPVVMYSNSSYQSNIDQAFTLGATAYLQKTTSFSLLKTNLDKLLKWNLISAIALPAFERTLLN